ncbi:MAG: ABC transporter permease [Phycisphaerales bacterium]|nr:ABC transporter permease [Phycisphaerales bacterium]
MIGGAAFLAVHHARANALASAILVACFALTTALPLSARLLLERYAQSLTERAAATPLVAGARGSRFDLVLSTTHFRRSQMQPATMTLVDRIAGLRLGVAIPMSVEHTARGYVVVGTGIEYAELRGLRFASGQWPTELGQCVLGSRVARREGLGVGDQVFSEQSDVYDISKPPAIRMNIVGVLEPTGGPDDDVVFVDIATAWAIAGILHGHDAPNTVRDANMLLQKTKDNVAISGALIEYNEVTPATIAGYHLHADPSQLPVTSVLVVPKDQKSATLLNTEVNLSKTEQMVRPSEVMDELLSYVLRIKSVIDVVSVALVASNAALTGLILMLTYRARAGERRTLLRIGAARGLVPLMFGLEFMVLVGCGMILAGVASAVLARVAPDIVSML